MLAMMHGAAYLRGMNDSSSITTSSTDGRDPHSGQFQKGHKWSVGHGRPRGARDRHTRNFLEAYAADFEVHGASVIEQVRREKPDVYLRIAADLVPRHTALDVSVDLFADARSFAEAFAMAADAIGGNADAALRRLRKTNPKLIEARLIDD